MLLEILKSAESKPVEIPEVLEFDPASGKVRTRLNKIQEGKEFVCLRVKQEKNVMMPNEYKIIVLIFLHNMFKGIKINLMDTFDSEAPKLDVSSLSLGKETTKNILLTAEKKMFDYTKGHFYCTDEEEYLSPFFPELFKAKQYDEKLRKIFEKLKLSKVQFRDFIMVSGP